MNLSEIKPGLKVKTNQTLGETTGMFVKQKHLDARRPDAKGVVRHYVPGHGGDAWFVAHGNAPDGSEIGAYCFDEFELAGATVLMFEDWEAEQMKDPEFRAAVEELGHEYQAARMEYSKNERAGQLLGFRESGAAVLEPSELGYRCPVCKNVPLVEHEYDERLTWSEYNSFLWCEVCNRDFPSCLCLQDIGRAIEIFLDSVETATPHKEEIAEEFDEYEIYYRDELIAEVKDYRKGFDSIIYGLSADTRVVQRPSRG